MLNQEEEVRLQELITTCITQILYTRGSQLLTSKCARQLFRKYNKTKYGHNLFSLNIALFRDSSRASCGRAVLSTTDMYKSIISYTL